MKKQPVPVIPAEQIPEKFVVRQKKTLLLTGVILILLCGGVTIYQLAAGTGDTGELLAAAVGCLVIGAAALVKYKNHRIEVCGEEICYVAINGQRICFHAAEMDCVKQDVSENPKVFSADGRLLARFDRNMENFALMIAYLQAHDVRAS